MSRRSSLIVVMGRSLSIQLDRLRHTLDDLGQRLRDVVSRAVGETVGAAVRQTLQIALAEDSAREEGYDHPVEPRYRDPPSWREREESAWNQPSWSDYPDWHGAEPSDPVTYHADEPAAEPEGHRGVATRLLLVCCQAVAWWLRRHSEFCPMLTAVGVGAACGVAAYLGGPVLIAGVGLAGSALSLATLADAVRSGTRALAGRHRSE